MKAIILLLFAATPVLAVDADAIIGVWRTADDESRIEIYKEGDRFFGKIVDLKEKVYPADDDRGMAGRAKIDRDNPDTALRERPIIGLVLMTDFTFKKNKWVDGRIYDPESGKTYKCKLSLKDSQTLKVRGFIGFSALGRTEIWRR